CLVLAFIAFTCPSLAEIAVIVHPSNNSTFDSDSVVRIFLGKTKAFPNGTQAVPINLDSQTGERVSFEKLVLNKTASQLKAYWSKLVFTGKGTPPKEVPSAEIRALIASNPNLIGYIDAAQVDGTVKVVFKK
ncbi:MAG: phosphate ABC transporter substrate-binding protein, partial [Pseudomonadales bacterium]|nr:phosphate ABC transporter substrate-binding protein [Pseudomonadales bacterium]